MDLEKIISICQRYEVQISFSYESTSNSIVLRFYSPENNMYYQEAVSVLELHGWKDQDTILDCIVDAALRCIGVKEECEK